MRRCDIVGIVGVAVLVSACRPELAGPSVPSAATVESSTAVANPNNVLSVVVSVRIRNADSVSVRFRPGDASPEGDSVTPAVPATADSAMVPVLGLSPSRRYVLHAIAHGSGGSTLGDAIEFTTDTLPSDLPRYAASGTDPSPGYVVLAAGMYGLVIDNSGRVVWYRRFPGGPGLNFMVQPNGRYVARPTTPDPVDVEPWIELDILGNVTRTFGCVGGFQSRFHDTISNPDGSQWLMCDETRMMNLSATGGASSARVTGTAVQHVSAAGTLLLHWSPFDHFAITDLDSLERTGTTVNWTHGNALALDTDGHLIVSFRNLGEMTKIHAGTGAVLWRMGGRRNQFTFSDSPVPPFLRQHGVRVAASRSLIVLDNMGDPGESRAEQYVVDESARTARLARSYAATPGVVTPIGGSVQSLSGGRVLVSYGVAGRVEEYDAAARVLWSIDGNAGYVFRAQRIRSLYSPGVGTAP